VVDSDRYLFACHRYIDMNPVRAGLAARPHRYPWSSHRCLARGERDVLVTIHPSIKALSETEDGRHRAYRALFDAHDDAEFDAIRRASRAGRSMLAGAPRTGRPRKMVSDTIFISGT